MTTVQSKQNYQEQQVSNNHKLGISEPKFRPQDGVPVNIRNCNQIQNSLLVQRQNGNIAPGGGGGGGGLGRGD